MNDFIARTVKNITLFVGVFLIAMSLDSFMSESLSFIGKLISFLISSLPGTILILLTGVLWNKDFILGLTLIIFSIVFFILFGIYEDLIESILIILVVNIPLLVIGLFLVIKRFITDAN